MTTPATSELRVLVLAPTGSDAALVCKLLADRGLAAHECRNVDDLCRGIGAGAGAAVVAEEAVDAETVRCLVEALKAQPPWSDLPLLVFLAQRRTPEHVANLRTLEQWGNVTLIERPVRIPPLLSAIQSALRSRQRQYRLKLLTATTAELVAELEPDRILAHVWRELCAQLGLDVYFQYLRDADALRLEAYGGIPPERIEPLRAVGPEHPLCGLRAEAGRSLLIDELPADGDPHVELMRSLGIRAYVCLPLSARGEVLGMVSFGRRSRPRFETDEIAFMQTCCDYVGLAWERLRLTRQLRERAGQLQEEARRKDDFLAMLGHELRNPLAAISAGLQLLERISTSADDRQRLALKTVRDQTVHIVRLVDDLLDMSRITRGRIELRKEILDAREVVAATAEAVRPQADARGHRLEVRLTPEPARVDADRARLRQILENLLVNAVKYTDPGGTITLSMVAGREGLEIRVRDTGIGLTPEMLTRVFDLFVQDRRSLDRSQGGLGVGLTLVKRLTEMHGGRVEASSDGPGRGTEFRVYLPLAPPS